MGVAATDPGSHMKAGNSTGTKVSLVTLRDARCHILRTKIQFQYAKHVDDHGGLHQVDGAGRVLG